MAGTTFTNKRLSYHVSNTTGTITLEGDATINSQSLIDSFNGSVNSTTGQYGNFSYSESDGGQVNRSYNGSKDIEVEACGLIDSVIEGLKAEALK